MPDLIVLYTCIVEYCLLRAVNDVSVYLSISYIMRYSSNTSVIRDAQTVDRPAECGRISAVWQNLALFA